MKVTKQMIEFFTEVFLWSCRLLLWIIATLLIIPCVVIANFAYEPWEEMTSGLFYHE